MEFKFDPNQEFQLSAISAVADLFDGQPDTRNDIIGIDPDTGIAAVANRLILDDGTLADNLRTVQQRNGITVPANNSDLPFANYSIEMETGTGKTYVYLRTMLQLYQQYGYRKFIIVVPSVAVRETVLKSLQITESHLMQLYGNPPYNYFAYDSANLARINTFANSTGIEIMVMTLASFNKQSNIINKSSDRMEKPIQFLQATRPILILDEPQNMESELSKQSLAGLNPLFALRYSATHRNYYNLVYRLTPFDAYRQELVKRIEVASVVRESDGNRPYLRLVGVEATSKKITAKIELYQRLVDGKIKPKVVTVGPSDDLEAKSNNPLYRGFRVMSISRGYEGNSVDLGKEGTLRDDQPMEADREAIFRKQIHDTIEEHFRKQRIYLARGIKVLSLFFIDKVANYIEDDGLIRRLFVEEFDELKKGDAYWRDKATSRVHNGYFAKKRKGGEDEFIDPRDGDSKEADEAYQLIMKDKERLLSLDEPTAFIFSHSALREGWDNPNVFQICTMNQSVSDVKKRQEIGRGMRLAVNKDGDRVKDPRLNVLTVVANESYDDYVASLQQEIEGEYGKDGTPPPPINAHERDQRVSHLRERLLLSPQFQELWRRISRKTKYSVQVDSDDLVRDVLKSMVGDDIHRARIVTKKVEVQVRDDDRFTSLLTSEGHGEEITATYDLPNIVDIMANLLEYSDPPLMVTRKTLLRIYNEANDEMKEAAAANPYEFAASAVRHIKRALAQQLVDGITYTPIDEWYEQSLFPPTLSVGARYVENPPPMGGGVENCLYDKTTCDSAVEVNFANYLSTNSCVLAYVKLPAKFFVPTPVGNYNPDWAIVFQKDDGHGTPTDEILYLVRETKDTTRVNELPQDQYWKVACGLEHFRALDNVRYKVVDNSSDLPDGGWPASG